MTTAVEPSRSAVVIGAAGGIGAAIAEVLREDGHKVLTADVLGQVDVRARVQSEDDNDALMREAVRRHGFLDTLVVSAGVQHVAALAAFPSSEWHRLLDVLVTGPFLAIRAAWSELTARSGGRVVVLGSVSSHLGEPGKVAYTAAKHAVWGVVKVAAIEGGPHGLTANAVAPTWVSTPLIDAQIQKRMAATGRSEEAVVEEMAARQPIARFVTPEEIAGVVRFLVSPAAGAITGQSLVVDGGLTVAGEVIPQ